MSHHQYPNIGERFKISGIEFEITFINNNLIRYSTVAGGKIQHFPTDKYFNLLDQKKLILCKKSLEEKNTFPNHLSKTEVIEMNRKLKYVREIYSCAKYPTSKKEIEPIIKKIAEEIVDLSPPSRASVSRWFKAYISSDKNPMSLIPQVKKRGNRYLRFDPTIENIINTRITSDYLSHKRISVKALHHNIIAEIISTFGDLTGINLPSERSINRRVLAIDPYKRSKDRNGKYVAIKKHKAAGRGTIATRSLEMVEADGNILDVLVIDEETGEVMCRPYGTCLIDKYSRCIISFVITMIPFSSATLLKALKTAISGNQGKFGGLFETMIVDNGSDYISHSVRNFCNHTGINIEHGAPRDPNSKPHVERFFGTLNSQLVHTLPGTTFSNPSDKGDYKSEKYACLTLDSLNQFVERWIDNIYHKSIHRGHGRVPEMLWKESIKDCPIITYPIEDLDTIAREVSQRRVTKGRVTAHNLQWFSHALSTVEQDCKNKGIPAQVDVYIDSLDLGKVFVRDPRDDSIFIQADAVFPNYAIGLTLYEHKIIREKLKEKSKADLDSYGEYYLEIARWKLYEDIGSHCKKYSKKRIARIKETNKKTKDEKLLINKIQVFKKPKKKDIFPKQNNDFNLKPNLTDNSKNNNPDDPDLFKFERF